MFEMISNQCIYAVYMHDVISDSDPKKVRSRGRRRTRYPCSTQWTKKKKKNVITVLLWITVIADKKSAHNVLAYLHVGTFQGHFK